MEKPTRCPKCGSIQISSNQLDLPAEQFAQGAQVLHRSGMPGAALGAMAAALGIKIVNSLRHDWVCNACDHRFS